MLLLIIEMIVPASFFIWIGLGALMVGGVELAALLLDQGLSFTLQLVLFAGFSLLSLLLGRYFLKRHPIRTTHRTLNRRGEHYIGRVLTLSEPILNGHGHVKIDDTLWAVKGPDCPEGIQVRVIGVDGSLLVVERL